MQDSISVVIPCYGSPEALPELAKRLSTTLYGLVADNYTIHMVNDGCPSGSWNVIKKICEQNPNVLGINLSRNFGQHSAISAGVNRCNSDYTVVMDCDLQDLPEDIPKLYYKAKEGYDVVFGRRIDRQDSVFKKLTSKAFYIVYDFLTGFETDHTIGNFSIIGRKVVDGYKQFSEQHRPYSYFINWLGFNKVAVDIRHAERFAGKSSYTSSKLLDFALNSIISETNRPLKLTIKTGFAFAFGAILFAFLLIIKWAMGGVVEGWTSTMVAIFFSTGTILANLGLVGMYVGKIFDESKSRPVFIISELLNNSQISEKKEDSPTARS